MDPPPSPPSPRAHGFLRLLPDRANEAITKADLTAAQLEILKEMAEPVKDLWIGDDKEVTADELDKILTEYVFTDNWKVGRRHHQPPRAPTASDKDDLAVEWAILAEHCPKPPRVGPGKSGIRKPRKKADRKKYKETAPPSNKEERRKGASVFMCIYTAEKQDPDANPFVVQNKDANMNFIPDNIRVTWNPAAVDSEEEAYLQAYTKSDAFVSFVSSSYPLNPCAMLNCDQCKRIHHYNMQFLAYHMRNRLTNWSNGAENDGIPEGEDLESDLIDYKLCRRQASLYKLSAETLADFKSYVPTL